MQIGVISLLDGLVYGMLLFMLASGLTLILSMMGVLNFAHASIYMLGAYFAYQISHWVGFWPALVLAPVLCGLIGAAAVEALTGDVGEAHDANGRRRLGQAQRFAGDLRDAIHIVAAGRRHRHHRVLGGIGSATVHACR